MEQWNNNPILDTRTYEVEFPGGSAAKLSANINAENTFPQCDIDGSEFRMMSEIVDARSDENAVKFTDRL